MGNKIFTWILVIAVGVLSGVVIIEKQEREPLLGQIVKQQQEILLSQARIEKKFGAGQSASTGDAAGSLGSANSPMLEQRFTALEGQVKSLVTMLKKAMEPQGPPPEDYSKVYDIPIGSSPVRGMADAPITIVEFVDFQCPFCSRFYAPALEALKEYPDKVKLVIKNFPLSFHPQAMPAAKAALAAGEQGKYWEMTDDLLENNRDLSDARIQETAKKIGLDVDKFNKDLKEKDGQFEEMIKKDMELAAEVQVQGTPTFYLNGHKTMARDLNGFKKEIDEILKNSK